MPICSLAARGLVQMCHFLPARSLAPERCFVFDALCSPQICLANQRDCCCHSSREQNVTGDAFELCQHLCGTRLLVVSGPEGVTWFGAKPQPVLPDPTFPPKQIVNLQAAPESLSHEKLLAGAQQASPRSREATQMPSSSTHMHPQPERM